MGLSDRKRRRRIFPIAVPEDISTVRRAGSFMLDRVVPALFVVLAIATLGFIVIAFGILTGIVATG